MKFDRPTDPTPIPANLAVKRGVLLVNWPIGIIMFGGFAAGYALAKVLPLLGIFVMALAFPCAWLWWSHFVPQWRRWALRRGANPVELQYLAESASLVWPKGSIFERTEIRRDGR